MSLCSMQKMKSRTTFNVQHFLSEAMLMRWKSFKWKLISELENQCLSFKWEWKLFNMHPFQFLLLLLPHRIDGIFIVWVSGSEYSFYYPIMAHDEGEFISIFWMPSNSAPQKLNIQKEQFVFLPHRWNDTSLRVMNKKNKDARSKFACVAVCIHPFEPSAFFCSEKLC